MIPKNKNPLEGRVLFNGLLFYSDKEVEQWQKAIDGNKEQRNKDFRDAYQATLCKCGYDKIKCKVKEVKCDGLE